MLSPCTPVLPLPPAWTHSTPAPTHCAGVAVLAGRSASDALPSARCTLGNAPGPRPLCVQQARRHSPSEEGPPQGKYLPPPPLSQARLHILSQYPFLPMMSQLYGPSAPLIPMLSELAGSQSCACRVRCVFAMHLASTASMCRAAGALPCGVWHVFDVTN